MVRTMIRIVGFLDFVQCPIQILLNHQNPSESSNNDVSTDEEEEEE